jgi:hypothetical protein
MFDRLTAVIRDKLGLTTDEEKERIERVLSEQDRKIRIARVDAGLPVYGERRHFLMPVRRDRRHS